MGDGYYLARKLQSLFAVSMLRCVLCELVCLSEVCVCVCVHVHVHVHVRVFKDGVRE